jgi:GT2 family glycosyltransferase
MDLESVLGVLVLYKRSLRESETFMSLSKALVGTSRRLDLLVYDNSPESHFDKNVELGYSGNITYIHDNTNPGICKAYNTGFEKALAINKKWLLLLDQDTDFTSDYIESLLNAVKKNKNYVSIVPVVYSNGKIVSPTRYDFLGRMKPIKQNETNIVYRNITAINSGACVKIDFLNQINGFTEEFPLDMLDHWFFRKVNLLRKMVYVLDTDLIHDLSVMSFQKQMSTNRYYSILQAERKFYRESFIEVALYKTRLLLRILKQMFYKDKKFVSMSLSFLFGKSGQ